MTLLRTAAAALAATLFTTSPWADMPSRATAGAPVGEATFLAPAVPARALADLPAPVGPKQAAMEQDASGRLRVGSVRPLAKAAVADLEWNRIAGGYVARFTARSQSAEGLRVRLELGAVPGIMELRAQGTDGRIEAMTLDPAAGPEAWT